MKRKFEYKWVIAAVCFLMVFIGLGFCSSAKSIYTAAITNALGFSRSAFSINDSCRFVTTTILNMFFGVLVYKFGTKKLITAGLISLIISSFVYSVATSLWMFYIGGVFLGVGVAWTTTSMVGLVVKRWFSEHRGTVMGAILASNGIGAALCVRITSPIIYRESDAFGYQDAYRLVTAILIVLTVIAVFLYKEKPDRHEDHDHHTPQTVSQDGYDFKTLLKKPFFYIIMIAIFLNMVSNVYNIATPHFSDIGLDADFVSWSMSLQLIALATFKFLIGFIYDKCGLKTALNLCFLSGIIARILPYFVTATPTGKALTIAYSILASLNGPIETVLLPIVALDIFGEKCFDQTVGIITAITTAGQTLGSPLLSISYDITKSYNLSFIISTIAAVAVFFIMNYALASSKKDKAKQLT